MSKVGRLAEIHRYPVKSLVGERLETAYVERRGLAHDRLWAVRDPDGKLGSGKTSRRFRRMPGLLAMSAAYDGSVPVLVLPDGSRVRGDDPRVHEALSEVVGRPVRLGREDDVSHFDEGPIHLVTTSSLGTLARDRGTPVDARRLRPNLVVDTGGVDGYPEDGWAGRRVQVGAELVLDVLYAMPRCVMVDLPQAELPEDPGLLRALTGLHGGELGVVADVARPGRVAVGDDIRLL